MIPKISAGLSTIILFQVSNILDLFVLQNFISPPVKVTISDVSLFSQTDDCKTKYQNQLAEVNNDLGAVRKELLHTEQNRLDLETEKMALLEKCKFFESEKEKVRIRLTFQDQEFISPSLSFCRRNGMYRMFLEVLHTLA